MTIVVPSAVANKISTCSYISSFSRFSKCYHYWEYKYKMEATTNAAAG